MGAEQGFFSLNETLRVLCPPYCQPTDPFPHLLAPLYPAKTPGIKRQSGCKVCVWDIYRSDLDEFNGRLLASDPAATPVAEVAQAQMVVASMDAFEQLERQLQLQQQKQRRQQEAEKQQQEKQP